MKKLLPLLFWFTISLNEFVPGAWNWKAAKIEEDQIVSTLESPDYFSTEVAARVSWLQTATFYGITNWSYQKDEQMQITEPEAQPPPGESKTE